MSRHLALAIVAALVLTEPAEAQTRPPPVRPPPRPVRPVKRPKIKTPQPGQPTRAFSGRVGLGVARRLLESDSSSERARGLERLGAVGTPAALELLGKALEPGGAAKSTEERLVAVRALASHAADADVRLALVRALTGVGAASNEREGALDRAVRETAALALAQSRRPEALELLGKALRQEGPVAEAAAVGIAAHPPANVAAIVEARGAPTLTLVRLLGRLGDQRAFHGLRRFAKAGPPEVRAAAAVELTRLGDFETVALARHWRTADGGATFRRAAARILAMARDPKAADAIAKLLDDPSERDAGLELALESALPALVPALARRLPKDPEEAPRILAAIGRAGGDAASKVLARELASSSHGSLAAYALALSPGDEAGDALERALASGSGSTLRNAARAAVLREIALGDAVSGRQAALDRLAGSNDAADRAAAAWAKAALDPEAARESIASTDPVLVKAAARQAHRPGLALEAARRLARESNPELADALAGALVDPTAAAEVPTSVLLELIDRGGAAAPIAAGALARRDGSELRQRIEPLLASADSLVRASVALGLAESEDPSAIGLLDRAYRFETAPEVRRAIVAALSQRRERTRERTLALAATLDGDRAVREAARLARAGHRLPTRPAGRGTLWLDLARNDPSAKHHHGASLATSSGSVVPLYPDPDGALTAVGLPPGPVRLRLAPAPVEDKAPERK